MQLSAICTAGCTAALQWRHLGSPQHCTGHVAHQPGQVVGGHPGGLVQRHLYVYVEDRLIAILDCGGGLNWVEMKNTDLRVPLNIG